MCIFKKIIYTSFVAWLPMVLDNFSERMQESGQVWFLLSWLAFGFFLGCHFCYIVVLLTYMGIPGIPLPSLLAWEVVCPGLGLPGPLQLCSAFFVQ